MHDERLVGHWHDNPYGAMEGADAGFLPDGRGWAVWMNAAGGLAVLRFLWSCPEPGILEIQEQWNVGGRWGPGARGFEAVHDGPERSDVVSRHPYAIIWAAHVPGGEPVETLSLDEPLLLGYGFERGSREIAPEDDPSYTVIPYA